MILIPKNWRDFQHYKDRNPPWIRLHKGLLDNYEFQCLPVASRALAPMLWLLASDAVDGRIDATTEKLAFRLRMTAQEVTDALKPLIDKGFFVFEQAASKPLAKRKRSAVPETETEALQRTETEAETEAPEARVLCVSDLVAEGVDRGIAVTWFKVRKLKDAPLTQLAWDGVKREAVKVGLSPAQAVQMAAESNWQGFKASWVVKANGSKQSTLEARNAAAVQKLMDGEYASH